MIFCADVFIFAWVNLDSKSDKVKSAWENLACHLDLAHRCLALQRLGFAAAEEKLLAFLIC